MVCSGWKEPRPAPVAAQGGQRLAVQQPGEVEHGVSGPDGAFRRKVGGESGDGIVGHGKEQQPRPSPRPRLSSR